ncbi:uncharacterized protein TNCV_4170831 [Trichonephila clavipes]|nr:uncharacterized protein TNCV_4170831 [Trichonephila clavipes]
MEEKHNCIQTLVNKGMAQFCYKKQTMESYTPFTTCRRRQSRRKVCQLRTREDYAKKELITRIARWAFQLEEFDYEIEHRTGSRMKHIDALSRYPVMIVCNDTLTSKLKKAQEEDDNIQTLKSPLEKQESEEFFERNVGTKMRNKEDILIKDLLLEEMAKELLKQREFLRNDAKKNIETLHSENRKTYNRRRKKASLYKEGDLVAIQRTRFGAGLKLRSKFLVPYKVCRRGSLVVKVSYRGRLVTSSSPDPLKTRHVGKLCTINLSRAQTSSRWYGVVVRRGRYQLRFHPRHLTMVQNYEVRHHKPSCS